MVRPGSGLGGYHTVFVTRFYGSGPTLLGTLTRSLVCVLVTAKQARRGRGYQGERRGEVRTNRVRRSDCLVLAAPLLARCCDRRRVYLVGPSPRWWRRADEYALVALRSASLCEIEDRVFFGRYGLFGVTPYSSLFAPPSPPKPSSNTHSNFSPPHPRRRVRCFGGVPGRLRCSPWGASLTTLRSSGPARTRPRASTSTAPRGRRAPSGCCGSTSTLTGAAASGRLPAPWPGLPSARRFPRHRPPLRHRDGFWLGRTPQRLRLKVPGRWRRRFRRRRRGCTLGDTPRGHRADPRWER